MVAPVELVRELLAYRDMKMIRGRDWGMITALIAGGSMAFPVLAPVALGSMAALAIHKLVALRRRAPIAGVELTVPPLAPGATSVAGIARRFRATVTSFVDGTELLAEDAVIRERAGGAVLLRRSDAAPFWLDREDGAPVLVVGPMRRMDAVERRIQVQRGAAELARMGIPGDLAIAGALEVRAIRDASRVAIIGRLDDETVPELAFHRDGGRVPVLRGHAGFPLFVSC
jgi:hypothetical protein